MFLSLQKCFLEMNMDEHGCSFIIKGKKKLVENNEHVATGFFSCICLFVFNFLLLTIQHETSTKAHEQQKHVVKAGYHPSCPNCHYLQRTFPQQKLHSVSDKNQIPSATIHHKSRRKLIENHVRRRRAIPHFHWK